MLPFLIAAALLQAAPNAAPAAEGPALEQGAPDNGMPKSDYELVAWCHGALAGQLELEPKAKQAMEKIESKAKVAARAKEDAEMEKARRQYLKDYEHALAAAEAASPQAIHQSGVKAELRGYAFWAGTRNKEPIWLMLDWGMWDPNDVGCGDAAKRLYQKSTLLGAALKESDNTPTSTGAARPPPPGETPSSAAPAPADAPAPAAPADAAAPPPLRGPQ